MGGVLTALGFIIGAAVGGVHAGFTGIIIATAIWMIMMLVSYSGGDQILLASSRAVPVTSEVHPQLFNVVEEMKIAAGLPKIPKIYIINDPAPNAFATGRNPENASVAVTAGLLSRLNRDELQGVIAHEVSHIVHRDILFVTLAGVMLGSIVLISQVFLRGMFYSSMGGRRYSSRGSRDNGAQALFMILAVVLAILAPIFAYLLYFALSRRREYLADAGAVRLTRYPEGLASALEKIANTNVNMEAANKVTAPMYIANPFRGKKAAANLYSTHPPIEERIRILRNMSHGAALVDYEHSYESVTNKAGMIPRSAMKEETVNIRPPSAEKGPVSKSEQTHEMGDLMRKVNGFHFINCSCGITMKIPPNFPANNAQCPRCNRVHDLRSVKYA